MGGLGSEMVLKTREFLVCKSPCNLLLELGHFYGMIVGIRSVLSYLAMVKGSYMIRLSILTLMWRRLLLMVGETGLSRTQWTLLLSRIVVLIISLMYLERILYLGRLILQGNSLLAQPGTILDRKCRW